jgi:cation diffusion facilitator family transporter
LDAPVPGSRPGHDHDDHDHDHDEHEREREHEHEHGGLVGFVRRLLQPHSHDHVTSTELAGSKEGSRALVVSLIGLTLTAAIQLVVVLASGSVSLLADMIHNFSDALTAVPLGIAFWLTRRAPNRRYTYGYGRAEDLAGVFIVLTITVSAAVALWEAVLRLIHPRPLTNIGWVLVAGAVGFAGNELAAVYRIRTGRRIGSAALVADGLHARTDGFTSLAVVAGALGAAAGWQAADPIAGIVISVAILGVLRVAVRDIYRRLMDSVDPGLVADIQTNLEAVEGVRSVDNVRVRWVGHALRADAEISCDPALTLEEAHGIAEQARHRLLHETRHLADALIHVSPAATEGRDPHELTQHHF